MSTQVVTMLLGLWLMFAPDLLDFSKKISNNAHIVGPLIATFAIIAIWECTRNVRLFNLPLAAWLFIAPWILQYDNNVALLSDYAVAILVVLLLFVKPKRQHRFGGGWPAIWKSKTPHSREAGNAARL